MLTAFFLALFFFGTALFGLLNGAFHTSQTAASNRQKKRLKLLNPYTSLHQFFLPKHLFPGIYFSILITQNILRVCLIGGLFFFLFGLEFFRREAIAPYELALYFLLLAVALFSLTEFLPRVLGARFPEGSMRRFGPLASLYLIACFPIAFPFLKLSELFAPLAYFDYLYEPEGQLKKEIIALIKETKITGAVDPVEKKLIESAVTFRDRVVREVMVPRVDVFSLPAETTVKEAAKLLDREGYSRVPVYQTTVDNIVGVLMYKDLIQKFLEYEEKGGELSTLEAPIDKLVKNVVYTPETKKISSLLQEFRNKQMHFAVVVDEYGGTEGIVTLEDILEEIVGEISDEYDEASELSVKLPNGSWIVDPKLPVFDLEEELGIHLPSEGEFDTLGGYIYHRTGTIPPRGFVIEHDEFKIEILKSNERAVLKVKITPLFSQDEAKESRGV